MSAVLAATFSAIVAWWFAVALNIPVWRQWHSGDRADIALFTFIAVLLIAGRRKT